MKITSARFIKGIIGTNDLLYDGKFQVVFMGRSNVGKSSLINSLVMRNLARSSSNPGKTIRMDFFLINEKFYFVDLPGYGYAKHSREIREKLRKMIHWYLVNSEVHNRLVVLVLDSKVGVTAYDRESLQLFHDYKINHIVVANKVDHLTRGQKESQMKQIIEDCLQSNVIFYSSKRNIGKPQLLKKLFLYFP